MGTPQPKKLPSRKHARDSQLPGSLIDRFCSMRFSGPAVVIVPGFWESATGVFDELVQALKCQMNKVIVAELRSTGHGSSEGITLNDDIAAVRGYIEPLVLAGERVWIAAHSAGGFIASAAVEGLTKKARLESGLPGGVEGFAFICAGVFPRGYVTSALPFFDVKGEYLYCKDARTGLFNDLGTDDADYWNARLRPQPAADWNAEIQYTGHEEVECYYLDCQNDQILPRELQLSFAAAAQAEVTECDAGHMVMLSQPNTVYKFIIHAIKIWNDP